MYVYKLKQRRTWRQRIVQDSKIPKGILEGVENKGNPQAVGELTKSTSCHNIFKFYDTLTRSGLFVFCCFQ